MSHLIIATVTALFASYVTYADVKKAPTLNTNCDTVEIQKSGQALELHFNKVGGIDNPSAWRTIVVTSEGKDVEIDGLKVELVKKSKIDRVVEENRGWFHIRNTTTYYGVKVHVSAEENISWKVEGDVGVPVREFDHYVICSEVKSEPLPSN